MVYKEKGTKPEPDMTRVMVQMEDKPAKKKTCHVVVRMAHIATNLRKTPRKR